MTSADSCYAHTSLAVLERRRRATTDGRVRHLDCPWGAKGISERHGGKQLKSSRAQGMLGAYPSSRSSFASHTVSGFHLAADSLARVFVAALEHQGAWGSVADAD